MAFPNPELRVDEQRAALPVTEMQNDFLIPKGISWGVAGEDVPVSNADENLGALLQTPGSGRRRLEVKASGKVVMAPGSSGIGTFQTQTAEADRLILTNEVTGNIVLLPWAKQNFSYEEVKNEGTTLQAG